MEADETMIQNIRKTIIFIFVVFFMFLLLVYSDEASNAVLKAMETCAFTIIPSLFPYMVISSLIVTTGTSEILAKLFGKGVSKLLRVSEYAVTPIILGVLCGFPVGAKNSLELHRCGMVSTKETEHLIAVSNNTGPAFIVEVVGRCYFGSRFTGLIFYIIQIFSALIVGIVYGRIVSKRSSPEDIKQQSMNKKYPHSFMIQISSAISSAAQSSVIVSGFIIFFSVISSYLSFLAQKLSINNSIMTILSAFFEFSGGARQSVELRGGLAFSVACFAINFSGISVFAQTAALVDGEKISLLPLYICKTFQGVVSAVCAYLIYIAGIFPDISNQALTIESNKNTMSFFGVQIIILLACTLAASKNVKSSG